MPDMRSTLMDLRPVTFRYKQPYKDASKPIQYGLIAEEVSAVMPGLAVYNAKGQPVSRFQPTDCLQYVRCCGITGWFRGVRDSSL